MNREEYIGILETDNARLKQENQQLKEQLKQRDEVIEEAYKFAKENIHRDVEYREDDECIFSYWIINEPKKLLEILTKYKGDNNE